MTSLAVIGVLALVFWAIDRWDARRVARDTAEDARQRKQWQVFADGRWYAR